MPSVVELLEALLMVALLARVVVRCCGSLARSQLVAQLGVQAAAVAAAAAQLALVVVLLVVVCQLAVLAAVPVVVEALQGCRIVRQAPRV